MLAGRDQSRLVLLFAAAGHCLFHILVALYLTIVLALEVAWQRPYDELISLWTLGALLLGLAAPAAGWLGDRWGAANVMVVYFIGIGLATALCGFAETPHQLMAGLALIGFFGAAYHPVGTAWVIRNARTRGKAIATVGIFGGIGTAFAALIAGGLTDLIDWRAAFIVPGLVSVAIGLLLAATLRRGSIVELKQDVRAEPEPERGDVRRALIALVTATFLTTMLYYAFTTMLPKWFEEALGAHLGEGFLGLGLSITVVFLLGSTSQFVGGYFCDRGYAKAAYVWSFILKLAAFFIAYSVGGWLVLPVAVIVIFAFDIAAPVEHVLIARFTPSHRRGLAYGIRNGLAIAAAPLGVELVAWLYSPEGGFSDLFLVLAGSAVVVMLAALAVPSDRPRRTPVTAPTA